MKNRISVLAIIAVFGSLSIYLSSCEKDEGKLPNIAFKTGAGYTSADATVAAGDSVTIGISASKSEGEDVLKTLNIQRKVNTAAAATYQQITIPTAQEDNYSADFRLPSGAAGDSVRYTFTVTNRDGLTNNVTLKLTVN